MSCHKHDGENWSPQEMLEGLLDSHEGASLGRRKSYGKTFWLTVKNFTGAI